MRRMALLGVIVLVLTAALPVAAGDKHACAASADDCVKKMAAKYKGVGWLGIETGEVEGGSWAVTGVVEGSPADRAGFREGDVLRSLNGVDMSAANKEALKKVKQSLAPGSRVTYVVDRKGGSVTLQAELGSVPREVLAQWIGEHMLDSHTEFKLASK